MPYRGGYVVSCRKHVVRGVRRDMYRVMGSYREICRAYVVPYRGGYVVSCRKDVVRLGMS